MPHVQTPYGEIYYAEHHPETASTPLVLIHGAASSHLAWSAELRRLAGRRVLAPDLPVHGRSGGSLLPDISSYAQALRAWAEAIQLEKCIWVGHSMGGAIAQMLAVLAPEHSSGLVLMATAAKLTVNEKLLALVLHDQAQAAQMINKWSWSANAPESLKTADLRALLEAPAEMIYQDYAACNQFDLTDRLPEITVPTLIICGTADKMTPPPLSEFLAKAIPNATLKMVEGAGHWVMLEQPRRVVQLVAEWLKDTAL